MTTSTSANTTGPRTVRVSAGDRDWLVFHVTDDSGGEFVSPAVVIGFSDYWNPPTGATFTPTGPSDAVEVLPVIQPDGSTLQAHLKVSLFIAASTGSDGAHVVPVGDWQAWLQVTNSPSVDWVRCGTVHVR